MEISLIAYEFFCMGFRFIKTQAMARKALEAQLSGQLRLFPEEFVYVWQQWLGQYLSIYMYKYIR
jgi:valyl-tRNA synthetase